MSYSVPKILNNILPIYLVPALTHTLTHTLTMGLTHTLTPTLIHTLQNSVQELYFCYYCNYYGYRMLHSAQVLSTITSPRRVW